LQFRVHLLALALFFGLFTLFDVELGQHIFRDAFLEIRELILSHAFIPVIVTHDVFSALNLPALESLSEDLLDFFL